MPIEADDPTDIAAIASDRLITELESNQDFEVYATRVVVQHRDGGQIELWQVANEWQVVRAGSPAPSVLNWTTSRFEDLPLAPDHEAHRYRMPLSDAQQFAYRTLHGKSQSPQGTRAQYADLDDERGDRAPDL
jgi:hypothetical protein